MTPFDKWMTKNEDSDSGFDISSILDSPGLLFKHGFEKGYDFAINRNMREKLAKYAHDVWSVWMKYLFSKCELLPDGSMVIPKWAVERWTRQMNTEYHDLPEEERKSDKKEADEILEIFTKHQD
jgi:hypothetical protein